MINLPSPIQRGYFVFEESNLMPRIKSIKSALEVLNLPTNSTPSKIRSRYLQLCHQYHPDKYLSSKQHPILEHVRKSRFLEISEAYKLLKDYNLRSTESSPKPRISTDFVDSRIFRNQEKHWERLWRERHHELSEAKERAKESKRSDRKRRLANVAVLLTTLLIYYTFFT